MFQKFILESLERRVLLAGESAGASVAFTTYEAEDAVLGAGATRVAMSGFPSSTRVYPETEASGRAYVQLDATGEYVEFRNVVATNTIVIRHCIPDAAAGGGISRTLSLYVEGVARNSLTLSSKHNWLYGDGSVGSNGQSNTPTTYPHVYWDETRYFISGETVAAGSTIRLQKTSADTASYYRIDLVDLEVAPEPISPPPAGTYLSVTDYDATGDDASDDTSEIQACINAAKTQGKTVWVPAGTYYQNGKFANLAGVSVQGAGMWRTSIIGTTVGGGFNGTVGFQLSSGTQVRDLYIASTVHTNRNDDGGKIFTGGGTGWTVENVWMSRVHCGFWVTGTDAVVRGNRVRLSYADAINLNHGPVNCLVENNHVRGSGDDGIALLSETAYVNKIAANTTVRHNTVVATWWGHNLDYAGGGGCVFEYNYLADNPWTGAFTINLPSAYPMYPVTSGVFRYNTILRGGGNHSGQNRGAIWIYPSTATIENMVISDNLIANSIYHGIHLVGASNQQFTFERNLIEKPGKHGIRIDSVVHGSALFNDNTVTNVATGSSQFSNASANFSWTGSGNSWQPDTTPPVLNNVIIDDGTSQRSMIRDITFEFSEAVTAVAGAFTLQRRNGSAVDIDVTDPSGDGRTLVLSFPACTAGDSLDDGMYELTLNGGFVKDAAGNAVGATAPWRFHRLFGDSDGDRDVDNTDLAQLRLALNKPAAYNSIFDYTQDGAVGASDYLQVKARLTRRILV